MPTPYFQFKQFTIRHDHSAMKVGTDGVLLGAWAQTPTTTSASSIMEEEVKEGVHILDVGTGTGVIALMLAQRFPNAQIEGIDIDEESVIQAQENVSTSPFATQVSIEKKNFRNIVFFSKKYHLIVSNPPFYQEETLGGNEVRDAARHTMSLPFEKLIENAAQLLLPDGYFSIIIPYQSAPIFISLCAQKQLYLTRRTDIRSTERKPFKRTLLEFSTHIHSTTVDTLTLYNPQNQRTHDYANLTKDFYL